jgi:hypothetical protein
VCKEGGGEERGERNGRERRGGCRKMRPSGNGTPTIFACAGRKYNV